MPLFVQDIVHRIWPVMILIVAIASFQVGASLGKSLFPSIGPSGVTTLRLLVAAILLFAVLRPWRKPVSIADWPIILGYGTALGMMNLLYYTSLQTIPQGIAVALEFTGPLSVALLCSRRRGDLAWVCLAILGIVMLLTLGSQDSGPIDPWGVVCALGAGACWAGYILFGQRAGNRHGTSAVALGMAIGALAVTPIGILEAGSALLSWDILPLALGVAVLSAAIPYALEMYTLPKLSAPAFGTLMSLEPAAAALSALLLLGQELVFLQWMAIGLVVMASLGVTLSGPAPSQQLSTELH